VQQMQEAPYLLLHPAQRWRGEERWCCSRMYRCCVLWKACYGTDQGRGHVRLADVCIATWPDGC
jgi:hypothetical protein